MYSLQVLQPVQVPQADVGDRRAPEPELLEEPEKGQIEVQTDSEHQ